MDTRTGRLYESVDAAELAGALSADIVLVQGEQVEGQEVIRVQNGPFKGRVYQVVDGRRGRRLRSLEKSGRAKAGK